jgi:hypothetical protein
LATKVRKDLNAAGFITNNEKSIWAPTQIITWLGLVWDSAQGTLEITSSRVEKILATIDNITQHETVLTARRLAGFTGQIISAGPVAGNITRIMTRHCCLTIACAEHWDSSLELDTYCLDELLFWRNNLGSLKTRDCFLVKKPHCFAYSDASATGYGAKITLDKTHISHKLWKEEERDKSSTWRELSAVLFSLESFSNLLEYSHVKWYTDNQAAAKIVEIGSMKPDLHALAIKIFRFCASKHVNLEIEWIPRSENQQADAISKLIDLDDWQISNEFFLTLDQLWGPHTVDCLATYYNAKLPRFYSRFWNPGVEGVDFFAQNLEKENCLVVPPVCIISKVLHYLYVQGAIGTLVTPFWPSAVFWPLIEHKYKRFIGDYLIVDGKTALRLARNTNSLLGSERFNGQVIAFRCDFSSR